MRSVRVACWLLLAATGCLAVHGQGARYPNALRRAHTTEDASALPAADAPPRVPLLVMIFTTQQNGKRREWQRKTWLSQRWRRGEVRVPFAPNSTAKDKALVSWKYVYVMAREVGGAAAAETASPPAELDRVQGDSVTLSAVTESYANLVYKTLEALRWASRHVSFGALLKTDDDSIVHVGRVGLWLHYLQQQPPLAIATAAVQQPQLSGATDGMQRSGGGGGRVPSLYAGRVFNDSQIIRSNFTKRDLLHPEWYPDDFVKWSVPYESYCCTVYYPPYCSGGGYLVGAETARKVVARYDVRVRARRPVVHVEDAFVGILIKESGVGVTDITELVQDPPVGRRQEAALFAGQLLVHRVAQPSKAFEWLTYPVKPSFERAEQRRRAGRRRASGGAGVHGGKSTHGKKSSRKKQRRARQRMMA